jgi:hypothetical protein
MKSVFTKGDSNGDDTTPRRDQLGVLPDELLLQIFESLARISKGDLCNVSRRNKRCHRLADALLYRSLLFHTPGLHLIFSESLSRRPRRGSAIQETKLMYPSSELASLALDAPVHNSHYRSNSVDTFSRTISVMSNLEKLDIAVPDMLLHGIGSLFNGPFDLACLKWCSLFYQTKNDAYWDLRENIHIFAHPTLEMLIIRRAKLDDQGLNSLERPHSTPLRKLHLLECDINDDGLSDLLEFPEGLEEFVITQTEEPNPELEETSDNLAYYVDALKSQAVSLKTLVIDFPTLSSRRPFRMREFQSLTTLRLNWDYQLFGESSKKPRMHMVGLPPQLEVLELTHELGTDEEVTDLFEYLIETREVMVKNWKRLIASEEEAYVPRAIKDACKKYGVKLDIIGAFDVVDGEQGGE